MGNTISKNLSYLRRKKGYTQKELAKKTGLSVSFISHIENKVSEPSDENLIKIADALDVSVSDLKVDDNLKKLNNDDIELLKLLTKLTLNSKISWKLEYNDNHKNLLVTNINDVNYKLRYMINYSGYVYFIVLEIVSDFVEEPISIRSDVHNNYDYLFELVQSINNSERDQYPIFKFLKDLEKLDY